MNQDIFLYTLPQWFVFAGIIASVYGWAEHKKFFRMLGPVIFVLLAVYAAYAISKGYFSSNEFLTPQEIISKEMKEEVFEEMPFQARLLPAYLIFIASGILGIPAFFLEWKERKGRNLLVILTALAGLMGFFIIVGALRSL
jgi:hypothetical protein